MRHNLCGCKLCGGSKERDLALLEKRATDLGHVIAAARGVHRDDLARRIVRPDRAPIGCRRAAYDHLWCEHHRDDFPDGDPYCFAVQYPVPPHAGIYRSSRPSHVRARSAASADTIEDLRKLGY